MNVEDAPAPETVRAAGGVVWRRTGPADGDVEVLLVHRPRYDDWSLPKGKADPGETDEDTAVREVQEETGLRCRLGPELTPTAYTDRRGRPKQVRYWAMTVDGGRFRATDEVDRAQWFRLPEARERLSYPRDVEVVDSFRRTRRPWPGAGADDRADA